ncbi:MAG: polyprenyl synthetase family protein [Bacteroidales bacterium]|nr:polyprenyl synthetase family protein [Bacteroidales bacterium]
MLDQLYAPLQRELSEVERYIGLLTQSDFPLLEHVGKHLFGRRGKQLRPLLLLYTHLLFNSCVSDEALRCAALIEILHTSSLVHDDVVDEADRRRGQASVRALVGNRTAVLSGDYLISNAFLQAFHGHSASPLILSMLGIIRTMCEGELLQLQYTANPEIDEAVYARIIAGKTAALFGQCGYCGALTAGATPAEAELARQIGETAGMAFQIKDDLLDLQVESETREGKAAGNDLKEGKITLPALYYLRTLDTDTRHAFFNWLQRPNQWRDGELEGRLAAIRASGAETYCRQRMTEYARQAQQAFERLERPQSCYNDLLNLICC